MIEIKKLCAGYGKNQILNNIDAYFKKGKITTIIGRNGCGKSTLIKTLASIIKINSGEIKLEGKNIEDLSSNEAAKMIAYLPQNRNIPDMTVMNMVLHGRFPYLSYPRKYSQQDIKKARSAIKEMKIEELADKRLSELSGGMRQKVYIAMALCQETPVILMDEPSASLDVAFTLKLCEILKGLAEQGKTIVLVLHDLSLALKISDYILVMQDGEKVDYGTPSEIIERNSLNKACNVNIREIKTETGTEYFYEI